MLLGHLSLQSLPEAIGDVGQFVALPALLLGVAVLAALHVAITLCLAVVVAAVMVVATAFVMAFVHMMP